MFSYVRNFLYRHRRKFLFAGVAIGSVSLLSKYAERKLIEWSEQSAKKIVKQQRVRSHYELSMAKTRVMLLEILPKIRKLLEHKLDSSQLVQEIKDHPEQKRQLWEQLKLVAFCRTVCAVVCGSFAASLTHTMMALAAARTLSHEEDVSGSCRPASQFVQVRYMSCLQEAIERQLERMVDRIMVIVSANVSDVGLTDTFTIHQLESVLQKIILDVNSDRIFSPDPRSFDFMAASSSDQEGPLSSILPWSQYLQPPEPILEVPDDQKVLKDMFLTTVDVCNTEDFSDVTNIIMQLGLNYALDQLVLSNLFPHASNESLSKASDDNATEGDSVEQGCRLAKLTPALCQMLEKVCPDKNSVDVSSRTSSFYKRLVDCSQLEALSYNVYSAIVFDAPNLDKDE